MNWNNSEEETFRKKEKRILVKIFGRTYHSTEESCGKVERSFQEKFAENLPEQFLKLLPGEFFWELAEELPEDIVAGNSS